jgi:preprotein translocase subunit Sec61beta
MRTAMAGEKRGEGFHSAAGLIRYFDQEDEKALKIPPWFVVAFGIGIAATIIVASMQWPV